MDEDHERPKEHAEDAAVQDPGPEQRDGVGDHPGLPPCGHERDDPPRAHEAEDGDGDEGSALAPSFAKYPMRQPPRATRRVTKESRLHGPFVCPVQVGKALRLPQESPHYGAWESPATASDHDAPRPCFT